MRTRTLLTIELFDSLRLIGCAAYAQVILFLFLFRLRQLFRFWTLAQVSRKPTERLKTSLPSAESGSTQK